jgi:hypothetical protein
MRLSRFTPRALCALCALLASSASPGLVAQSKAALSKPEAEYAEPFTDLRGIRELPDGRVLVSDFRDKVVMLVDLKTGTATRIGREGQGPEEYAMPMWLWAQPDGGALLQDMGNRRFLPIGPDGKIGKLVSPPQPPAPAGGATRPGGMMMIGALLDARGTDAQGRLYFQGLPLPASDGAPVDSVPLMRWDRAQTIDTVGWLPVSGDMRPQIARSGSGDRVSIRIGGGSAWSKQALWGVAPDGRIALVQPDPYQVTWLSNGARRPGPVVPYTPIKVTEADKQEYLEEQAQVRPMVMAIGPGGRTAAPPPGAVAAEQEEPVWPDTKPAFTGRDAVRVTPEGQVWVGRTRKAGDPIPVYDVFDGTGRRTGQVTLRPKSRVVGFGQRTVYVVRSDQDDLQYLERYRR